MLVFFHKLKTRFFKDKVFDLSAQLAYYFLVSLFPFLFLLFTFLGFLPISTEDVLKLIQPYAPKQAFRLIEYNLTSILDRKRGELIYISILVTTWLASMGILAIIRVFNKAYQVEESRPLVKEIVVGIFLTLGLVFAVITSLLLLTLGEVGGYYVFDHFSLGNPIWQLWNISRWVLSFLILMIVFITLYLVAPNRKLSIRNVLPGAFFSTFGWQFISIGFSYYVTIFDYREVYGNLGALLTLMIWFYLSAMIMIVGGQINAILLTSKKRRY